MQRPSVTLLLKPSSYSGEHSSHLKEDKLTKNGMIVCNRFKKLELKFLIKVSNIFSSKHTKMSDSYEVMRALTRVETPESKINQKMYLGFEPEFISNL